MSFFSELRRRNVFRVAGVYAVVGWVLAQIANTLEESLGLPAWFDGVVVAILIIGLPIALVFAWAFELTPDGVVKTESVPEGESITSKTARKLDITIAAALVLLVIVLAWGQFRGPAIDVQQVSPAAIAQDEKQVVEDDASIAVLPFADLSPESDQEYFSDGLAEEILNVLVAVDGLEVASRTSSFQFKGQDLGIPDIATKLKVRHVVEGSVRKAGNTIRVTAQLIDSRNDKHLWSDTYDRPLSAENIFSIQDEIAQSIVEALSDTLGLTELQEIEVAAKTKSLPAYELYLKARPLLAARTEFEVIERYLADAVAQDPEFAEAWELRAATAALLHEYRPDLISTDEAERLAKEYANQALSINPNSATAIAVLAKIDADANDTLRRSHPIAESIAGFSRALEINPRDGNALNWRGLQYTLVGDTDSANEDFMTCVRYEPYHAACADNLSTTYAALGQFDEAHRVFRENLDKGIGMLEWTNFNMLARVGSEELFKAVTNGANLLYGWHQHEELYDAFRNPEGDHSQLIESIRAYAKQNPRINKTALRILMLGLGDYSEQPDPIVIWGYLGKRYHDSDEFKNYLRAAGVLDYWQQYGYPDTCRPIDDDDFECD